MKKILVIDDAEFILEGTAALLRFEGYDVITAPNGKIGVETAISNPPDLVLCDVSMPELDGYGVLDALRNNASVSTLPFIFLTARAEKSDMRIGMEKGADDYLIKPFTRDELVAAIEAQWQKHSRMEKHYQEKADVLSKNVTYALPHEFRTVLNEVIGSASYLKNISTEITPDDIQDVADDILYSSRRLLKITENFLVYAQIETLTSDVEARRRLRDFKTDEPGAMLTDVASFIAQKNGRTSDLQLNISADNIALETSGQNFHKIVDELLDNAFKFSSPGDAISVNASTHGGNVSVEIKDAGRGMAQAQIDNVGAYKQFERLIHEQQGVGLGLVIAKRLVELHDGDFTIESADGQGTTIRFTLPCKSL
ncbi:MAG TPA: response regulator [Patescibacteria group bacterium]|nr:response regulator [Patescibacteria group bacterium]